MVVAPAASFLAASLRQRRAPQRATSSPKTRVGGPRRNASGRTWSACAPRRGIAPGCAAYGYESALGRRLFLNRDPIEEEGGLNLYGFCGNDGVNQWDYLGMNSQNDNKSFAEEAERIARSVGADAAKSEIIAKYGITGLAFREGGSDRDVLDAFVRGFNSVVDKFTAAINSRGGADGDFGSRSLGAGGLNDERPVKVELGELITLGEVSGAELQATHSSEERGGSGVASSVRKHINDLKLLIQGVDLVLQQDPIASMMVARLMPVPGKVPAAIPLAPALGPPSLMTNSGAAYFWSGLGRGGATTAAGSARAGGGTTLEMLLKARGIKMPAWDATNPASVAAWRDASAQFARGASGDVRVVLGDSLRPGNLWQTVEMPALQANPNVSRIIRVNPSSGAESIIWSRP